MIVFWFDDVVSMTSLPVAAWAVTDSNAVTASVTARLLHIFNIQFELVSFNVCVK